MPRKLKNEELDRKSVEEFKESEKIPVIVILDNVRSSNNTGSVFRTCDAFLVEKICLCGITSTPPNKDIHKTALGAEDSVSWQYYKNTEDAVRELKNAGYLIISVEQTEESIPLQDFRKNPKHKYALVFGHEVKGVSQGIVDISDYCIEIPQFGTKHSFNITVSVGIVLWELLG